VLPRVSCCCCCGFRSCLFCVCKRAGRGRHWPRGTGAGFSWSAGGPPGELSTTPYRVHCGSQDNAAGDGLLVSYGDSAVEVTVNDRRPYVGERELNLSPGAAEFFGLTEAGVDPSVCLGRPVRGDARGTTRPAMPRRTEGIPSTAQAAERFDRQYFSSWREVSKLLADQYAVAEQYQRRRSAEAGQLARRAGPFVYS